MVALLDSPNLRSSPLPLATLAAVASSLPLEPGKPPYRFSVSPADEVRFALADARSVPNATAYRYVTLGHLTPEQAAQAIVAVNLALQSTSRVRAITPAVRISETVLRIDAAAYVNDAKELDEWTTAWAQLAQADFYHHLQTQIASRDPTKPQSVNVAQGFLGLDSERALRIVTNTPGFGAVLRADYFATGALRPPAYYGFLGVPKTKSELLTQLGLDEKAVAKRQGDAGANLHKSDPTKKPRRVIREQSITGGFWITLDSRTGDAFHNPLYRPISADGSQTKHDAEEVFFQLSNGCFGTVIYNDGGTRLDVVDPIIASDYMASADGAADTQIYAGYSCLRCHAQSGLNSFTDGQSELLKTKRGTAVLSSYDPALVTRILGFYDSERLATWMDFDRKMYAIAMARIGCTPAQANEALSAVVKWTLYDSVTPEVAATELTTAVAMLPEVIGRTSDPNGAALLEGHAISRDAWQSFWTEAATKRWSRP